MYKISKQFAFSASHILQGLSSEHPCARMHGHNYMKDYRELSLVKEYIDEELDHRHLNDIFPFNPTAENIAKAIYDRFKPQIPELYAVEVSETPKTTAVYEADC